MYGLELRTKCISIIDYYIYIDNEYIWKYNYNYYQYMDKENKPKK